MIKNEHFLYFLIFSKKYFLKKLHEKYLRNN